MTPLQLILIVCLFVGVPLSLFSRKLGSAYYRYLLLLLIAIVMLLPFAWLVCAAIKDRTVLNVYPFLPPISRWSSSTLNFDNFRVLFAPRATMQGPVSFWRYVINSIFLASAATTITLFFSSLAGYTLAKFRFRGDRFVLTFMLASMTIPAIVLLAPNFETIYRLGWMDTYKALLIPGAVSVFGTFLFRQACLSVPDEILEAGRIDGCSEFRIYLTLVMPLVRPMIGAFCLVSFLGSWNAFIAPNIFLHSQDKLTLPVILNQYVGEYQQHYGVFLPGTLLAIVPPAILFFALQREFVAGLTSGAVKQ